MTDLVKFKNDDGSTSVLLAADGPFTREARAADLVAALDQDRELAETVFQRLGLIYSPDWAVVSREQRASEHSEFSALRLEVAAWRALAGYSLGGARRLLFGTEVTPSLEQRIVAYAEPDDGPRLVSGKGDTPQAAAIDLARKLQLIPAEPDAESSKGSTDG